MDQTGSENVCGKRVLIVEDEEPIAKLFCLILTAAYPGIEIDAVEDPHSALEMFEAKRHALVITDVNLPQMSGPALFRRIEAACTADGVKIPTVVFCTGNAHVRELSDIVSRHPSHCVLTKPVTRSSFLEVIGPRL